MASLNKVILMGNLTRDPEVRYIPSGTAVATLGLAVNRRYTVEGEQREEVCFIDCVAFGRQAETAAEYLAKGSLVLIEGRLQWRSWETDDGQKRSKHEVVANNVQFMPRSGSGDAAPPARNATAQAQPSAPPAVAPGGGDTSFPPPEDDDIPFVSRELSDAVLRRDRWEPVA